MGCLFSLSQSSSPIVRARIAIPDASFAKYAALFVAFDGLSLLLFGVLVACAVRPHPPRVPDPRPIHRAG